MPTRANALAVMAKAPIPGSVKTRMVPPLTHEQAAELCRALLLDQLEHLSALSHVDLFVAFTPANAVTLIENIVPAGFQCFPQRGADLGARMNAVFDELLRRGHRNIVLIGSDLPALPVTILDDAFQALEAERQRVVLGPSRDGGYYLIGMNRPTPEIFKGMSWSHDRVFSQTIDNLAGLGIDFTTLPGWFDLDTVEDIDLLRCYQDPAVHAAMKRTMQFLQRLNRWDRFS